MELQKLKNLIESKIYEIESVINNNMPNKGISIHSSQKIYLIQKLNEFYHSVNGIIEEDLQSSNQTN